MVQHIVAHRADPDGLACHAIMQRVFPDITHTYADYDDFPSHLEALALSNQKGSIVIADLSCDAAVARDDLFSRLVQDVGPISWYDHHSGSFEREEFLRRHAGKVVLSSNHCASKLLQQEYAPNDEYAAFLANLGQVHDFEKTKDELYPQAETLQDLISAGVPLNNLVNDLAAGLVWHNSCYPVLGVRYGKIHRDFRARRNSALTTLEESVEHHTVVDFSLATAYADPLLYMKAAPRHLKPKVDADCLVIFYDGNPNVIFEAGPSIGKNILPFLEAQGGGGRGHGGGFTLDHPVTPQTYQQDKEEVLRRFQAYFSKAA